MRNLRALSVAALAALLWAGAAAAGTAAIPDRHAAGIDGAPVSVVQPGTGATFSAWSFRGRGEYDLAISSLDTSGRWSEPVFLGRGDGRDQIAPAIVADPAGSLYVAYAVRETSQIWLSVLPAGASEWSAPVALTRAGERGFSPALSVVADRLVAGWREFGGAVRLLDVPLVSPSLSTLGINDGPDGIDPLGQSGGGTGVVPPGGGKSR